MSLPNWPCADARPVFRAAEGRVPNVPWRRLATAVVLTIGLAHGVGAQEVEPREGLAFLDTGPLRIRDQLLIGMEFLAFDPVSADVLAAGEWQLDLVQSVTNSWVQSENVERFLAERGERASVTLDELRRLEPDAPGEGLYHVDGELYRTSLSVRRGLGKGLQLNVTVPVLDLGGGFGDSLIEDFHDTFGFDQVGRQGTFQDDYLVYVRDPHGNELSRAHAPGLQLSDISLGIKARLPAPAPWQLAVEGTVKLPTGDEEDLTGSGAIDVGTQLLVTRYYRRSCIHAAVAVTYLGESALLSDQILGSAMFGYERAIGSTASIVAQATISQSPYGDLNIDRLDDIAYLVDLGLKKALSESTVLFVALSENVANFGNSMDVGLHLGITRTIR